MRNKRPILFLMIVVMILQLVFVPAAEADVTSYYNAYQPKNYKVKNTFELVNSGANEAYSLKATVLIGATSSSPYQQNISYKVTPWPKYTYVDSMGNIYAEVFIDSIKPKETKTIVVEKEIVNSAISYSKDIFKLGADYTAFRKDKNNLQYFSAGDKVETGAPEIVAKASAFDTGRTKVQLAKDIYDFVNLYIKYDTDTRYANKGALSGLVNARGVCDEYASLFTALCRVLGVPARVVTGYWIDKDKPLRSGVWNDVSTFAHAWAEFYIPLVGWIPVEPTFIYTLNGVRTPNSDYFANIKADDIHLLHGYQPNSIKSDINIYYSFYKETKINIKFGEQSVMPVNSLSAAGSFADVENNWAKEYINRLYNQGVLFAKQENLYKPADNITRAEFSAFLVNTLRLEPKSAAMTFKDVKDSSDYASFIKTAAAYGLILGDNQGYFKPNDPITRQDAATIMKRAIDVLGMETKALAEPQFNDVSQISLYAKDAVKLIYNMQIMTGKPGNMFEPKSYTTRAEVSKILDNFINATK